MIVSVAKLNSVVAFCTVALVYHVPVNVNVSLVPTNVVGSTVGAVIVVSCTTPVIVVGAVGGVTPSAASGAFTNSKLTLYSFATDVQEPYRVVGTVIGVSKLNFVVES